jgi:hypothetical protein
MTESQELDVKKGIIVLHPKEGKGYKTKCKVSTKIEVRSNTHGIQQLCQYKHRKMLW